MQSITTINPNTGQAIETHDLLTHDQMIDLLIKTDQAYLKNKSTSIADRKKLMHNVATILDKRKEYLAQIITHEMGKTYQSAKAEIEKCAWVCRYYADQAESFLSNEYLPTEASQSYLVYRPLGVILAIMPWNYPFWQVFRFAAPAIMAGNAGILKHASNVPGSALAIQEIPCLL